MPQKLLEQQKSPFQKFIFKNGIYIAMGATAFGLFIGIPLVIWFLSITVLSIGTLFILLFICGALGLIQWKYVREHIEMEYRHFAMYAFSGFGLCLVNFLLFVNLSITIHKHIETVDVSSLNIVGRNGSFDVGVEDAALARCLNTFLNDHFQMMPEGKKISIVYETGLLGLDKIADCKFN